jgi:hypothetical protein
MGATRSGDIAGASDASRCLAGPLQLRVGTGLLLFLAGLSIAVGWALRADGAVVEAAFGWRIAFVALVSAAVLNVPVLGPLWRGRVHFGATHRRAVPFAPAEFAGSGELHPRWGRSGVSGQGALAGAALIGLGALVWVGGLAFAPLDTTGTVSLRAGQRTSDVRPVGMRMGDLPYGSALPHEHTFLGLAGDGSGAVLRALEPRSRDAGEYVVVPGAPVPLGPHRVALVSAAAGPPLSGLRVRAEREGVQTQELTLRPEVPVRVGETTFELVALSQRVLDGPLPGGRVRVRGPEGAREVWLMPEDAALDAEHGAADGWVLTPLELVGTERVELRFTARWVWWWRVAALGLLGVGAFLLLLVPHRSWVWMGRPGDLELRAWSLNASGQLRAWSDSALREALGEAAFEELHAVERELATAQGGR